MRVDGAFGPLVAMWRLRGLPYFSRLLTAGAVWPRVVVLRS